jgi:hypothetical protein
VEVIQIVCKHRQPSTGLLQDTAALELWPVQLTRLQFELWKQFLTGFKLPQFYLHRPSKNTLWGPCSSHHSRSCEPHRTAPPRHCSLPRFTTRHPCRAACPERCSPPRGPLTAAVRWALQPLLGPLLEALGAVSKHFPNFCQFSAFSARFQPHPPTATLGRRGMSGSGTRAPAPPKSDKGF